MPLSSLWVDVVRALEMSDEARALELCPSLLTHRIELDVNEYVPVHTEFLECYYLCDVQACLTLWFDLHGFFIDKSCTLAACRMNCKKRLHV